MQLNVRKVGASFSADRMFLDNENYFLVFDDARYLKLLSGLKILIEKWYCVLNPTLHTRTLS
jgi:hypothetical protein